MWNKNQRLLNVVSLYQMLYWDIFLGENIISKLDFKELFFSCFNSTDIQEVEKKFRDISTRELESHLQLFLDTKDGIFTTIKTLTNDWDKTSLLTKSVFISAYIEYTALDEEHISHYCKEHSLESRDMYLKKLTSNYLRICEQYGDKNSVPAAHAILVKLFSEINCKKS